MLNSTKNLLTSVLKTIVVLGFVCSTFACEESIEPQLNKMESSCDATPGSPKQQPSIP